MNFFTSIIILLIKGSNRLTCPHTTQQNGSIERTHHTVVESSLSLLAHSSVPPSYWDHAFLMTTYTLIVCQPHLLAFSGPLRNNFIIFQIILSLMYLDMHVTHSFDPSSNINLIFDPKCVVLGVLVIFIRCSNALTLKLGVCSSLVTLYLMTHFPFKTFSSTTSTPLSSHVVLPSNIIPLV